MHKIPNECSPSRATLGLKSEASVGWGPGGGMDVDGGGVSGRASVEGCANVCLSVRYSRSRR